MLEIVGQSNSSSFTESQNHFLYIGYSLMFFLMKLVLLLLHVIVNVEKIFLVIKIIKNTLYNRMRDKSINDSLVTYIE